jgi:diguanylate cyclase
VQFAIIMTRGEMTTALAELDQALYIHEQWCDTIHSTLICRLPADERDLAEKPHILCPFGQWYYARRSEGLGLHPGFVAVETEHEHLHRVAAQMLKTTSANHPAPVREYQDFLSTITRMRSEILGLKNELEEGITNLDPLTGANNRASMLSRLRVQQEAGEAEPFVVQHRDDGPRRLQDLERQVRPPSR